MSNLDRTLDRALSGRSEPTEDIVEFVEMARRLEGIFDLDPPFAGREKALFSAAVAARGRTGFTWGRLIAPVVAGAGLVAALGFASGSALPGDALYPVRRVLHDVGINEGFLDEADERIEEARLLVIEAEDVLLYPSRARLDLDADQVEARALAIAAIQELAPVDELLEEVDPANDDLALRYARLDGLINRATAVIAEAGSDLLEGLSGPNIHGAGRGEDSDDNSGPGSEADSSNYSSGSGSGDVDDDPSTSGSNEDSDDGEDSSGDSDSDDGGDSSDSGSGDSDSDDEEESSDSDPDDGLPDGGDDDPEELEGSDSESD